MEFTLTDVGITRLITALDTNTPITVASFRVGDGTNPQSSSDTDLSGTTLYTGGISYSAVVASDTVRFALVMDQHVGTFTFSEVGIYTSAPNTLLARGVLDQPQQKEHVHGSNPGNVVEIYADIVYQSIPQAVTLIEAPHLYLPLIGGTMFGPITLVGPATSSLQPVTLSQMQQSLAQLKLELEGSASSTFISSTPPSSPGRGNLWFDDTAGRMYIWDSRWIGISAPAGGPGGGGIEFPEPPTDGRVYGRQANDWFPVLPLTGGTVTGQIILQVDPYLPDHVANKKYVDWLVSELRLFEGTWSVAANDPNIVTWSKSAGNYWIAVTANPNEPEAAPAGLGSKIPAGTLIHNGDMIIWSDEFNSYELIRGSPLTKIEADQWYVSKDGDQMHPGGTLTLSMDANLPMEAVPLRQLESYILEHTGGIADAPTDGRVYGRQGSTTSWFPVLPLTGGTVTGQIVLQVDPYLPDHVANKKYVDWLVSELRLFEGTWRVETNTPDISNPATAVYGNQVTAGDYFIAVTDIRHEGEYPPSSPVIPGLPHSELIHTGDMIIWNANRNEWQVVAGSPLTKIEADEWYVSKDGDEMRPGGTLTLSQDADLPLEAVPLRQLLNAYSRVYIGTLAPANPRNGELWWNPTTEELKIWNGTAWVIASEQAEESVYVGSSAPSNPGQGQLWWDSSTSRLKVYIGSSWIDIGPGTGGAQQITFSFAGNPPQNSVVNLPVTGEITIPASLAGVRVYASTAPTAAMTFVLYIQPSTQIGTIILANGSQTSTTLSGTGGLVTSGQTLQLRMTSARNSAMRDVSISIPIQ